MVRLTAEQAAARLGVKVDTIYAYVSRGALQSQRRPGSRSSFFDPEEVEALARRGRPRRSTRPTALDLVIESRLTSFGDHRVLYRGRDVAELAESMTFEEVAEWLWTGEDPDPCAQWEPVMLDLPDIADPRLRLQCAVVIASANDARRADLTPSSVVAAGRSLIATMADSVPSWHTQPGTASRDCQDPCGPSTIAERLWSRLAPEGPSATQLALINAALVVTADHELVPSTLAARIAASVRADPYAVVLAGLGTLAGILHGRTNRLAYELLESATTHGPGPALERSLELHGLYPGFGHYEFPRGDPRADLLIDMVRRTSPANPVLTTAHDVIEVARAHAHVHPNIDMALAVIALANDMPPTAGEVILTVARTAGWLAHALEEYGEAPARFRAKALPRT